MARLSTARILLLLAVFTYLLGAGGWLGYGLYTETGVPGWLMQQQMSYLGGSRQSLTMLGTLLAFIAGITPLLLLTMRLDRREGGNPFTAPPGTGPAVPLLTPADPRTTKRLLAGASLAISLLAYFVLTQADTRQQAAPVAGVDLIAGQLIPAGTLVARVKGVFNTDYLFTLEQKRAGGTVSRSYYGPLTSADWKPGQPVHVVLRTLTGAYYDSLNQRALVYETATPFPATFDGSLSQEPLPTYVRESFTQQGLRLANPCYVLDDQGVTQGTATPAGSRRRWQIPVFGLVMALLFLFQKVPAGPPAPLAAPDRRTDGPGQ